MINHDSIEVSDKIFERGSDAQKELNQLIETNKVSFNFWIFSSMAEQSPHKRLVLGSNPRMSTQMLLFQLSKTYTSLTLITFDSPEHLTINCSEPMG